LIDVHLRPAEIAPAALVAAAPVTVIATETETVVIARRTATETETAIVTGMIATVGIGIEIAGIGTVIFETRRRTTIVVAGAPTASAACRPPPSKTMMFLGLLLQVLACLPSVRIRTKNYLVACLVAVCVLLLNFGSVVSPKSLMCLYCAVGLHDFVVFYRSIVR
jgi:hypothetical protein